MTKIFVQWMLGQFLVVKVNFDSYYYIEFEVLYPYTVIKGDYFCEDNDLCDENNFWIIKNFINRVVAVYLEIAITQKEHGTDLQDKKWFIDGDITRQVTDLLNKEHQIWWEDDYLKFFSKNTVENIVNRIECCLENGNEKFVSENFEMDREIGIEKMKNIILQQQAKEVYIYLCDRRFNHELKDYHKKIDIEHEAYAEYELILALTESSYSYPDLCLTTDSDLLRKEFEKKSPLEKINHYTEIQGEVYWNPYFDLAKEWLQNDERIKEFNALRDIAKVNLYNQMINGKSTGYDDLLRKWWRNRY